VKPQAPPPETEAHAAKVDIEGRAVALGPSMEAVVERANLKKALAQVKRNKGAGGIDGMTVDELPAYLKEHWPTHIVRDPTCGRGKFCAAQ
jgi:RNA-directed DNA polymerase